MTDFFNKLPTEEAKEAFLKNLELFNDSAARFALYVTIGLIVILLSLFFVFKFKLKNLLPAFNKILLGIVIGYSATLIFLLGYTNLTFYYLDGKITKNFWLIFVLIVYVAVAIALVFTLKAFKFKQLKIVIAALVLIAVAYAVTLAFVLPPKKSYYEPLSKAGMYIWSAVLVAAIIVLALIFDVKGEYKNTKNISYAAVCIALSFALSYVKFFTVGKDGGSVTFASLLPLMIYAYTFGTKKGVIAGVIYGLLQFIQAPHFYQPLQALLDYPIAFGAIGLAGIARRFKFLKGNMVAEFIVGAFIAVFFRYVSHFLSGYYVFYSWKWEGFSALTYSMVYNLFCFVDLAVLLVPGVVAFSSKSIRNTILTANVIKK